MYGYAEDIMIRSGRYWKAAERMAARPGCLLLHLSFILVIAGGLLTWLTAEKGSVRLVSGKNALTFCSPDGSEHPLPVTMSLDSFDIVYYMGDIIPRDYVSHIIAGGRRMTVSVNKMIEIDGYRLCQSGYDSSGASILSVNHDPWGIAATYIGYVFFAVGGLSVFLVSCGIFRRVLCWRCRILLMSVALTVSVVILLIYFLIQSTESGITLPELRINAELFYNSVPFSTIVFILLFIGAFLGFLSHTGWRLPQILSTCMPWVALCVSSCSFLMMWLISCHIPLSNTFETLLFVVIAMETAILCLRRQSQILRSVAMLFAGVLALIAHFVEVPPVATPLMPVLNSRWLSFHVSVVMISYALFALTFSAAAVALLFPVYARRLQRFSLNILYPAIWLLGLGIIAGSVWANESWGEYWSWDPKETWALVTLLVYALPLHMPAMWLRHPRRFHIYMFFALAAVGITYFGVNLLDSLHAYA